MENKQNPRGFFDNGKAFFELGGNAIMKLSPKAAIEVCQEATKRNLWILGVDGGHWLNPGFRPDGSASWSGKTKLFNENKLSENNQLAIENIWDDEAAGYTAFIVTLKMP
ncbi:colicin transporter [Proteus mirabilis]|uniref:colicin transporter n=1 Tax=Proteus mirabilis TaxID=584 RepID=UPI002FEFB8E1